MSGNVSRPGATVTSRALALVGAFDDEHRRLTLSQLAERAGLPVPTAHRLVGELVAWGAIGARTTESPSHRQLASGLSNPGDSLSGIPVVVQNSGANVLIQNATVINLQLK